ncbi:MAG: choice-of-anchor D domain-containing protein, partial [Acidobacteriota bacterium]|nr:choice-of-anchor D domain-containing protein [Acidobacteriota bacterium]
MRIFYVENWLAGILTATLILFVASLSGCSSRIVSASIDSSSSSAATSSSAVVFGIVPSDTSSSAQTVKLFNTGNTQLIISSIALSGINANSFHESNDCPTSLVAGSSCTITVDFSPVVAGSYTAAITITDNASPPTQTIVLNGTGPPVAVSVSPVTKALNRGQTLQLTATVTNASDTAVTWSIRPAGEGSIGPSGLYTAPATITTTQIVTVTATSQADTTASSSASITLEPSVAVNVRSATTALTSGRTAQLTATVTNTSNKVVSWSIRPAGVCSISSSGLYTAPASTTTTQIVTVTATSQADTTASSSTAITLEPSVAVSVNPTRSTAYANGIKQLAVTVRNALNSSVRWSALLGTITSEGLYTAPSNMGNSTLTDTITAASIQDPTISGTATITVSSG